MLTSARRKMIEELAEKQGEVVISALARELGVSVETVRRDINALSAAKKLIKVHGGAVCAQRPVAESAYDKRRAQGAAVKRALGSYAAQLIKPGEVIALSTGSTMEEIALSMRQVPGLTVITNSVAAAGLIKDSCKCVLLGGQIHSTEGFTFGPVTLSQLNGFHADKAFVGASAVDSQGLTATGMEEGDLTARMMESAQRVILVVQSKKLAARSVYRFAGLEKVSDIVTDTEKGIEPSLLKQIGALGIKLHTVEV